MKIIDLLNMWANGEDVNAIDEKGYFASTRKLLDNLNSEIELEDTPKEDKKIKKLDTYVDIASFNHFVCYDEDESLNNWTVSLQKGLEEQTKFNRDVLYKINEIIDKVNGD